MPALDALIGTGAIHIMDQNKLKPVATLCGQAIDKPTISYLEYRENFERSTCKVCRRNYFDEAWIEPKAEEPVVEEQRQEQQQEQEQAPVRLFDKFTPPVNDHTPKEPVDGA